jgi:hypothetical protein
MKVEFLTELELRKLDGDRWLLLAPYAANVDGSRIDVPAGFVTDLASVPRWPIVYWLAGGTATKSSVLHDWLYRNKAGRKYADEVFLAAMEAEGMPWWRRNAMYAALRAFGSTSYEEKIEQEEPLPPA